MKVRRRKQQKEDQNKETKRTGTKVRVTKI